jgi:hypothetical protein
VNHIKGGFKETQKKEPMSLQAAGTVGCNEIHLTFIPSQ